MVNIGQSQYVPLPKWDPAGSNPIPTDFFTGAQAVVPGYPALVNQIIPNPDVFGVTTNLCTYATRADLTGLSSPNGLNHTVHDQGHVSVSGSMGNLTTAAPVPSQLVGHDKAVDFFAQ